ncbi:MAG: tetratricopeptide repeat protein [Terracidiphilus sp.]
MSSTFLVIGTLVIPAGESHWEWIGIVFVAVIVFTLGLARLKRSVVVLMSQGKYDEALRMNGVLSKFPGYGPSLAGPILFSAGRYPEARAAVKPQAFDERGQPRLTSLELYTYALALTNDDMNAEAQQLLEAAVRVPQRTGSFHVALVTCLLDQRKEPERALQLMEQAMTNWPEPVATPLQQADHAKRLARYAWTLAACGRRKEAETKLDEAFAAVASLPDTDRAGVKYFAGETWRTLGEWRKARTALDESLLLSPTGSAATGAQKALVRLRQEAQA